MGTLKLTDAISLEMRRTRRRFTSFAGHTNRLALYSVSLLGLELNLYVARAWSAARVEVIEALDPVFEDAPAPPPPHGPAAIVPFRPRPVRASPARPRVRSSRR